MGVLPQAREQSFANSRPKGDLGSSCARVMAICREQERESATMGGGRQERAANAVAIGKVAAKTEEDTGRFLTVAVTSA